MRKCLIMTLTVAMFLMGATAAYAASNPSVTIVNPVSGSTIYSDNLLVSVKLTEASSITVSVTQELKAVNGENAAISMEEYKKADSNDIVSIAAGSTDSFTTTNNLSFYTKKVENVKPGVYKITVSTVDPDGKELYANSNAVEIKPKEDNPADAAVLETPQSGPAQFLKNLLKIIFKD